MKKLIVLLSLLVSTSAWAGVTSITVQVPADSDIVTLTARDVSVDLCNVHGLEAFGGHGAATNVFHVGVISTEIACEALGFKKMDLSTEILIEKHFGQPHTIKLILDTDRLANLEIGFDNLARPY